MAPRGKKKVSFFGGKSKEEVKEPAVAPEVKEPVEEEKPTPEPVVPEKEEVSEESTKVEVEAKDEVEQPVEVRTPVALPEIHFEHALVERILEDGRHFPDRLHCKMSDGTTKHVPVKVFEDAQVEITHYLKPADQAEEVEE